MNLMLEDVIARGTGKKANIGRTAAGKTGLVKITGTHGLLDIPKV